MKVLSVSVARSISLIPTAHFNPKGRNIIPILDAIKERYFFPIVTPLEKVLGPEKESVKFEHGSFMGKDTIPIDVSFAIHNDGIVADTQSSTEDSDLFLEDLLTWLSKEYDLVSQNEIPIKKLYLSELYFTLDKTPQFFSDKIDSFAQKASDNIKNKKVGKFNFQGISLGIDPELSERPLTIRVEREVKTAFSENRYFSSGPLETKDHLSLLESLETI